MRRGRGLDKSDVGIEIGHTLDKYELLEKVGQGGMAVVYRGRDLSLKREVAIKVLHRHLAEHGEARDRFEREAQAVAKLRHENILEIFDYSGKSADESYIVTEFIAGQTLKEFVTDHEIRYPEIGAMIAVQVCRALSHAHSLGVLHRDVKPENIMIRNDGVVKLTDFGIAQMLDVQRLTMTGQLLGSPAYMSPEHVEGKPLDFRTDVFAVGIVLYQLVTGELPFKGRNPHEILKRIADGKYIDARQQNPLVGNRLAAILRSALAREPDDRFPDIGQMVLALEDYLSENGLTDFPGELGRFFGSPVSYEMALKSRLSDTLTRLGRARLREDRNSAVELFNRVLTIDPGNAEVTAEIERLSRRARGLKLVALFGGVAVLAAAAVWIRARDTHPGAAVAAVPIDAGQVAVVAARADAGPRRAAKTADAAPLAGALDAGETVMAHGDSQHDGNLPALERPDAGVKPASTRSFTLIVSPRNSEVRVDDGPWRRIAGSKETLEVGAGKVTLAIKNSSCCEEKEQVIKADDAGGELRVDLGFLPAKLTPICSRSGDIRVSIDGKSWPLGRATEIAIESMTGTKKVEVTFTDGDKYFETQTVDVKYKQTRDVPCAP